MTCIVAVTDGEQVTMGGDSSGISGWDIDYRSDSKVFHLGDLLIGFTSSFRMGQILRYNVSIPNIEKGADLYEWMVKEFVPVIRTAFIEHGFAKIDGASEKGGQFIVGIDGSIFVVESDYQVAESLNDYYSIGCGYGYATGSLYSTESKDPLERVNLALEAATYHSAGVAEPFTILKTND